MIEILIVIVLVLFNGFFALSEMAVMTSRKQRLKQLALTSARARKAMELAEHPENFLSAVQVWITLLGLLTSYFGGQSLAAKVQVPLMELGIPLITKYAHTIAFACSFILIDSKLEDFLKNNIASKLMFILQQWSLLWVWLNSHFHSLRIS